MTNKGSYTRLDDSRHDTEKTGEAALTLGQIAACRPPYDAVRWEALAERVVASAQNELVRRRMTTGMRPRRGMRAWWEVTADWVRPAVAAAVAMIAIATALMVATPGSPSVASGSEETTAETLTASADAIDAVMLETPGAVSAVESSPLTRDSLFSALVDAR